MLIYSGRFFPTSSLSLISCWQKRSEFMVLSRAFSRSEPAYGRPESRWSAQPMDTAILEESPMRVPTSEAMGRWKVRLGCADGTCRMRDSFFAMVKRIYRSEETLMKTLKNHLNSKSRRGRGAGGARRWARAGRGTSAGSSTSAASSPAKADMMMKLESGHKKSANIAPQGTRANPVELERLSLYNGPLGGWTVFVLYSWEQHEQI
ncbi:hypothetical protein EVAR_71308_1 [Eumeta japonica]|uniref:Uncharacterized protein n=1 Tax=Eumeta variegata TaxID=151549 RepID=A0A4C2AD59_EUMVA|nr:hypothetical protein EVAR_71308_1 [Eumeta japonica]